MEEPEHKAALRATACSGAKFAKIMRVITAKAKVDNAHKTGWVKEKLDHIISLLRMQMQMMLHDVG